MQPFPYSDQQIKLILDQTETATKQSELRALTVDVFDILYPVSSVGRAPAF